MKTKYALALAFAAVAAPALAEAPAVGPASAAGSATAMKRGAMIFTADGRRLGRIDRVRADAVGIIYNGKYIDVPTATLSASDRGFTTSLTKDQLGKN